ncbi:hypothetical protein D3C86_2056080 [compost metagenome]
MSSLTDKLPLAHLLEGQLKMPEAGSGRAGKSLPIDFYPAGGSGAHGEVQLDLTGEGKAHAPGSQIAPVQQR